MLWDDEDDDEEEAGFSMNSIRFIIITSSLQWKCLKTIFQKYLLLMLNSVWLWTTNFLSLQQVHLKSDKQEFQLLFLLN